MKKLISAGVLALGLGIASVTTVGCTSQQIQTTETTLLKVLQGAAGALDALAANPTAIPDAEAALSALAAVAPQTGPVHQAIVNAQAALNALAKQQSNGNVAAVQTALQNVIGLLETQGAVPVGAVRQRAFAPAPKAK